MKNWKSRTRRAALGVLVALPCVVLASPPDWAPAHGWRKKHDPAYAGYSGRTWDDDYGVQSGPCRRSDVGAVLGVMGAVVSGCCVVLRIAQELNERPRQTVEVKTPSQALAEALR